MENSQNNLAVNVGMIGMRQVLEVYHSWHLDMTVRYCQFGIKATRPLGFEVLWWGPVSPSWSTGFGYNRWPGRNPFSLPGALCVPPKAVYFVGNYTFSR